MSDKTSCVFSVGVEVSTTADGAVSISCHPESIAIDKGKGDVLIAFALTGTPGFSFSPSIAIVPADNGDFPHQSWTINNTLAALYDRNNKKATVKYTVNVIDAQGNPYSYDPDIQNGGSVSTAGGDC